MVHALDCNGAHPTPRPQASPQFPKDKSAQGRAQNNHPDTLPQQVGLLPIAASQGHRRTGHGKTTTHRAGSKAKAPSRRNTGVPAFKSQERQATRRTGHVRRWASVSPGSEAAWLPGVWQVSVPPVGAQPPGSGGAASPGFHPPTAQTHRRGPVNKWRAIPKALIIRRVPPRTAARGPTKRTAHIRPPGKGCPHAVLT